MEELLTHLDNAASKSKPSKLWVDCFKIPVFIMMLYGRTGREGDWPLDLVAVKLLMCTTPDTVSTMKCSCSRSKLPCALFCKCTAASECLNELIKTVTVPREEED